MASKKLKKFLAAGVAAYAGSKMLGDKGSGVVGKTKEFRQSFNPKKSMFQKIINMGPGKNATSKKGGTLAGDYSGIGLGSMDGAKKGKFFEEDAESLKAVYKLAEKNKGEDRLTQSDIKQAKKALNYKEPKKAADYSGIKDYGAKYGKMIKANNGVMVESRGNKLARSKPTKIC